MTNDDHDVQAENAGAPVKRGAMIRILKIGIVVAALVALAVEVRYLLKEADEAIGQEQGGRGRSSASGLYNNFDVSNATIPKEEIRGGGPPRDGIPAINNPKFVAAKDVDYLGAADKVIGLVQGDVARAYPLKIVVHHEIVNDMLGDQAVAVTYCPLCGTSMVFDRKYGDETLTFGVSGLLFQSDVLMYDRQSDSLWSQLKMESVAGKHVGTKLKWLSSELMTWAGWQALHPESEVLSMDTGFRRNYGKNPYGGYEKREGIMFPVPRTRDELSTKDWVVGIVVNGEAKAYPVKALERLGDKTLPDLVGGTSIRVAYDAEKEWPRVTLAEGDEAVPHVNAYWFAWQAFYPETGLYSPQE